MSAMSLLSSYDCLNLRHQYDGTLCGFNLDFSQGYFPKRCWLFHPRDLISMHICTTEPQNLITLFPVQPQMVCHLQQVSNTVSQFLSKVESSITEATWEVSSPSSCSKGGWTLKSVQVAQGSCLVKFWKPPMTDTSKLLWVTCSALNSPEIEKYFAYNQLEALISQFTATVFSATSLGAGRLLWSPSAAISSPGWTSPTPLATPRREYAPAPITMLAPAGLTPVWTVKLPAISIASDSCPADCPPRTLRLSARSWWRGWGCSRSRILHLLFLKLMRFCSTHYCSLLGFL